jgi:RecB family exonuclease
MLEVGDGAITLTPSGVAAFRRCGFQQLWLREQGEGPRACFETPAAARGRSLHAALAEFHRNGGAATQSLAELHRLLRCSWLRQGYPDAEEERIARLRSEQELATYYETFGYDEGTLATERTWSFYRVLDGVPTHWCGRLDWLRREPGGGLEVIDWKSGAAWMTPEALADDPAPVLYARLGRSLAERHLNWPRVPVTFSLLCLERAEKVSVRITREMVQAAEAELAALARGLQAGDLPATEGPWCSWQGGCQVKRAGACPLFPAPPVEGEW